MLHAWHFTNDTFVLIIEAWAFFSLIAMVCATFQVSRLRRVFFACLRFLERNRYVIVRLRPHHVHHHAGHRF